MSQPLPGSLKSSTNPPSMGEDVGSRVAIGSGVGGGSVGVLGATTGGRVGCAVLSAVGSTGTRVGVAGTIGAGLQANNTTAHSASTRVSRRIIISPASIVV
jgi:hypothetical protein